MKDYPLVSIGVASYNNAKYIIDTLDSVRNQSYPNVELLIVDDCSKDNSREVIDQWIALHNLSCTFIKNPRNLGLTKVCNILLNAAAGEYFAVFGSDDIYASDKLSKQVALFQEGGREVAVVFSDVYLIDENGEKISFDPLHVRKPAVLNLQGGRIFTELLVSNFIPAPSVLVKRKYLLEMGGYDESLSYEDYDMWLKLARKYKFVYSREKSACYRIHSNSIWNNRGPAMYSMTVKILSRYLGHGQENDKIIAKQVAIWADEIFVSNQGNKYLKVMYLNFKLSKSFNSLILLIASAFNVKYEVLQKINGALKSMKSKISS